MIVGVGVDLVAIVRVRQILERHGERARHRLFTSRELGECDPRADAGECLAARFAAKEAVLKALGTGKARGLRWTDIEVTSEDSGDPRIELAGEVQRRADVLGVNRTWVSLSHEGGLACAVVVLESTD